MSKVIKKVENNVPLVVIFNDVHLKDDNADLIESIVQQCINLCISLKVKFCVFNGDFFDQRQKQALENLMFFKKVILMFRKAGIFLYASAGNHEKTDLDSPFSYLSLFKGTKGFKLFEDEGYEIIDGVCYCFLPYFTESGDYLVRLVNLIESIEDIDLPKILFTHAAIERVRNNDGSTVENDVKIEYFCAFKRVFVAHYHDKQNIAKNIHYNGSTHQSNFGEDDKKGFTVLYDDFSFKLHKSKFPKYINLRASVEDKEYLKEILEEYKETTDNVKLTIVGSKDDLTSMDRTLITNTRIDVRWEDVNEVIKINMDEVKQSGIVMNKKDILKHWMNYAAMQELDSEFKISGLELLKAI